MLTSAYTAIRLGALVYVGRNVKECRSCPIVDGDRDGDRGRKDNDIEANEMDNDADMEPI
jgi:hypothetical protein